MDTPDPTNPVGFRAWTDETVRFADLDPLGHANNTAFNVYFESARAALFTEAGALEQNGRSVVIARLTIDFRTELNYGDQLRIGTRLLKLRRTSAVLGHGLFRRETCAATAEVVCVLFDLATHRPTVIAPDLRRFLEALA
jgi:acyl-CoA thioester hydrolase